KVRRSVLWAQTQASPVRLQAGDVSCRRRAVADSHLGEEAGDVVLDRFLGQEEALGDLAIGLSLSDQFEYRHLAWGEPLEHRIDRLSGFVLEGGLAVCDLLDPLDQLE